MKEIKYTYTGIVFKYYQMYITEKAVVEKAINDDKIYLNIHQVDFSECLK